MGATRRAGGNVPERKAPDMTGTGIDLIVIPIVASLSLAAWLIMVYYADSHPQWRGNKGKWR
jgi:hypothetical protein